MNRTRSISFSLLFLFSIANSALADDEGLDAVTAFDIPAQSLEAALIRFSEQSDLQLVMASAVVEGKEVDGLSGELVNRTALDNLLAGSGLAYESIDDRTIAVSKEEATEPAGKSQPAPGPVLIAQNQASAAQTNTNQQTSSDDGEDRPIPLEEIIVTGTNIRGVTNPASPVITFDREDIDRSGLATLPDFIQTIPQNFTGGLTDVTGVVPGAAAQGGNATQGTGVNLRGLGSDSTLVLLNGRRLAPAGLGTFTDISTIPASAVERIEIVLDGASAVYGADAVGGVVNIILRDDLDGAETAVRYEAVTDGGRDGWRATQAFGTTWDSGNVLANYEFFGQSPLQNTERDFTENSAFPFDISSDTENHSVFVAFSQDLFDDTALFATANYSTRESFTNGATTFGVSTRDISIDQYGGVAGLDWDLPGSWLAEVSTGFNRYESKETTVFPAFDLSLTFPLESEVWSWDAKADGELVDLPGGTAKLALGAGTRNEKFANNTASERDVRYAFAETLIPLVQPDSAIPGVNALEVSAAIRHEDYDDFGSSTDGKLGIVWSPVQGLQIRGTVGTSFRAPLLIEARPGPNSTLAVNAVDPQSPTGTSPGLLLSGSALSREAPGLGTPLKPEEAEMFTIGMDFNPAFWPGFSASVSYFDIDFTGRIAAPGANLLDVLVNPAFSPVVTRNPTPDQIADVLTVSELFFNFTGIPDDELISSGVAFLYDGRTANITGTTNSGIDLQLGYTKEVGEGQLGISLSGTYLSELENKITSVAIPIDRRNTFLNPIDLRLRAGLFWSKDRLNTNLFVNYVDSYRDDRQTPEAPIGSFTTIDWTVSYEWGGSDTPSLLRNVRLLFGAENILDEDPPFVDGSPDVFNVNFDARNASPFGRILSLQITKNWLGGTQ